MKQPVLKNESFLQDVRNASENLDEFHLWWLGQSGFLLKWGRKFLAFDPYLSDSLTRKYAATDRPHIRMTERVVAPEKLDFLTLATSSHNHTDHLDAETLNPILQANPNLTLVIPEANRGFVADRLGIDPARPVGMVDGETREIEGFQFTAVPAAHESVERDEHGRCRFLGYVVSFGNWSLYHSGDTMLYDGIVETLRPLNVTIAMLPINGRARERRVAGNLNGPEAARLAREIGARLLIPHHFDMFTFNTASPEDLLRTAAALTQPCKVMQNGERWSSAHLPADPGLWRR